MFLKAVLIGYITIWSCEAKLQRGNHTIPLFLKTIKSPFRPERDQEYTVYTYLIKHDEKHYDNELHMCFFAFFMFGKIKFFAVFRCVND